MVSKRKPAAEAFEDKENNTLVDGFPVSPGPATKKGRGNDASVDDDIEVSHVAGGKGKKMPDPKPAVDWMDVTLDGEDEGDVPIFDDCNDIRRKIRLLQRQPDFKVTHWLRHIGGINANSFSRFMKASGPTGGAENGVYPAAYIYFEKVRIATGKKKTAKRIRNEELYPHGLPLRDRKHVWVFTGR